MIKLGMSAVDSHPSPERSPPTRTSLAVLLFGACGGSREHTHLAGQRQGQEGGLGAEPTSSPGGHLARRSFTPVLPPPPATC